MNMESLFYRENGEGKAIIILHGVFGSSDNWMSIARDLSTTHKVYTLDQRNHGQSFHSDRFDYPSMVEDLKGFIEENEIVNPILIGHSMGGKVAMSFAMEYQSLLQKLIVVDIAPRSYPIHHDKILNGLSSIDLDSLESRGEADQKLAQFVSDPSVRNFLLKNLSRDDEGKFKWKINLPIIRMNIERVGMGLAGDSQFEKETLFIRGSLSDYVLDSDLEVISKRFPNSKVETIENAGHWVHAEQPVLFLDVVREFIQG